MNKQEMNHIKILSLHLLIEAKISKLPVDLMPIAKAYKLEQILDESKPRYSNAINLSKHVLAIFGYKNSANYARHLGVRILSPIIILRKLGVESAEEIVSLTGLPPIPAKFRYNCYRRILNETQFAITNMELKILDNFKQWIQENS